jgi:hypothetical protein
VKCRICGCGDFTPCIVDGVPCCWVTPDLCSACLSKLPEGEQQVSVRLGEFLYLASMAHQLAEELPDYNFVERLEAARLYHAEREAQFPRRRWTRVHATQARAT